MAIINTKRIPKRYRKIVKTALLASAAAGPLGVVVGPADAAAIAGIWGTMMVAMLGASGIELDKDAAIKLAVSVITGSAGYYAGCKVASQAFNAIPLAGTAIGAGVSTTANVLFTYQFAWVLTQLLEEEKITVDSVGKLGGEIVALMIGAVGGVFTGVPDIVSMIREK